MVLLSKCTFANLRAFEAQNMPVLWQIEYWDQWVHPLTHQLIQHRFLLVDVHFVTFFGAVQHAMALEEEFGRNYRWRRIRRVHALPTLE